MRIHQLPSEVVTKIAAGEVIERPASVVKELLENAVDAGSRRIEVDIEQGGGQLIGVVDDGCGIPADDLPLAFASHATSKLATSDDLFRIDTLGFRGEALASIGGVAQVTLQSRTVESSAGAEISCHGGELSAVRPWNGAPGTRIEVRHLFYNTPVRRKFLRTIATEIGHICEVFTRVALARPGLHLILRHNGKHVYEVPASTGLLERLGLFFGAEVRDQLYALQAEGGPATLHGFIADPACERGNAKMQYFFVNGRFVRDRSLGHALQEAYRGLIMVGRYPVAVLFLDLPSDQVDVNVHPTKAEVRFRDGHALYHLVLTAIRERLRAADLTARLRLTAANHGITSPPLSGTSASYGAFAQPALPLTENTWRPTLLRDRQLPALPPASEVLPGGAGSSQTRVAGAAFSSKAIQLYDAYLVLETPEGMLVIDQHALHERILFEEYKERLRAGELDTQPLLIPQPVDLPAEQAARALEYRDALRELGLEVEDFGGGTLLLTSYPAILSRRAPQAILQAVIDYLVSKDRPPTKEVLLNDLMSLMACHAAVRAGDRLQPEQIAELVARRDLASDTHHCPHGRPTSLLLTRHELDRQFRRT
jgi:DNA mismatch repair protein MutL